jgi:adenine-specific DNA-methyltransferase
MPVLQFKGKSAVENYHHAVPHHRLEFDAKLSLLPKGQSPSLDGNLIIEGDNLLALKALLPTHSGRVKCVYIDPPYNTGNEGWVYNDNLTQPQFKEWIGRTVGKEGEDACRHDKWCCMMYPRLVLLRELMCDDGLIWVSIDDNENHNLRQLLDEVFGVENRIATIIWQKSDSPSTNVRNVTFNVFHEYILCYARVSSRVQIPWRETPEILDAYPQKDDDGRPYRLRLLRKNGKAAKRADRPSMWYPVTDPDGTEVFPIAPEGWEGRWSVSKATYKALETDGSIRWIDRGGKWTPYTVEKAPLDPRTPYSTIWTDVGQSRQAKASLTEVMGVDVDFDTPKPVDLIQQIIGIATEPGDIVLDSFAGSGTTCHAVVEGFSDRSFVLVQQPDDTKSDKEGNRNICHEITAERVRRVMSDVGGSFTYARVGDPLFGEYKDFGDDLPAYEDIAKYVFYTETSREFPGASKKQNPAWDKKAGRIGEHAGRSYYLLYEPNEREDRGLDRKFLKEFASQDPSRELVVYCERLAVHQDELRKFHREHGKRIRHMLVPFNLK